MPKNHRLMIERPGMLIPVFFLSCYTGIHGQYIPDAAGASAIGGCFSALTGSEAIAGNQAGLGWDNPLQLSIGYSSPLLARGIGSATAAASLPIFKGNLGIRLVSTGLTGYLENTLWISYGIRLFENITAGAGLLNKIVSVNTRMLHRLNPGIAAGIQAQLMPDIRLAGHLLHSIFLNLPEKLAPGPTSGITVGGSYSFMTNHKIFMDLKLDSRYRFIISGGVESGIKEQIWLRAGFRSEPATLSLGIEIINDRYRIFFTFQTILISGVTPSLTITYEK